MKKSIFLLALLAISFSGFAQQNKPMQNKSMHGGQLVMTGKYHVEMVHSGNEYNFYVMDANMKMADVKKFTGMAMLQTADGKMQHKDLMWMDGRFMFNSDNSTYQSLTVTLTKGNQKIQAQFAAGNDGQKEDHSGHDNH
jgi:hypothetical protein